MERELSAVKQWISSKHPFHIMRDHPGISPAASARLAFLMALQQYLKFGCRGHSRQQNELSKLCTGVIKNN